MVEDNRTGRYRDIGIYSGNLEREKPLQKQYFIKRLYNVCRNTNSCEGHQCHTQFYISSNLYEEHQSLCGFTKVPNFVRNIDPFASTNLPMSIIQKHQPL